MSRLSCAYFLVAVLGTVVAAGCIAANSAHAQGAANVENVNLITADGVKLRGSYYPADKKCLATVIMLHSIGEGKSSKAPEWRALAETLQKAGYSALMFDFRGHGDSTAIDDEKAFWGARGANGYTNAVNVKPKDGKTKDTIDVKDYIKQSGAYLPVLINDIAAARAYLERRNDNSKDCNTSSIIVIGVDNGATLGAIWINSEWSRFKATPPAAMSVKWTFNAQPEGHDIIGAVFLTPQPGLSESRKVNLSSILKVACKDHAMAAAFFVGQDDKKNLDLAKTLQKNLQVPKNKKWDFIGPAELANTSLSGMKLLTKSLKTDAVITDYLESFVADRRSEWTARDFDTSYYMWKTPSGAAPAKMKKGEKTLVFDDYSKFIPQ